MRLATALIDGEERWGLIVRHPRYECDWIFFPEACERIFQRCAQHPTNGMHGCLKSFAPEAGWQESLSAFLALEEPGMLALRELERYLLLFLRRGDQFAIETAGRPLSEIKLCSPIPRPRLMLGLVQNSPSFWRKNPKRQIANFMPQGHQRPVGSILGEGDVFAPVDGYNVELGVIVGKAGKDIPVEKAREYVAGYTVVIDGCHGSFWDSFFLQKGEIRAEMCERLGWHLDAACSWGGKKADARCAVGPWMVTEDEIGDVYDLLVYTLQNDTVRDRSHTAGMSIGVERTLHFYSTIFELYPGDIIHMGTLGTDGLFQELPMPVTSQTRFQAEIECIGRLSTQAIGVKPGEDWRSEQEKALPLSPATRYLISHHRDVISDTWTPRDSYNAWLCFGNYRDSWEKEQMRETPYPRFLNAPASCVAQNAPELVLSKRAGQLTAGVQLAFVVSRMAYCVDEKNASSYIAGYCTALCVTDHSIRDEIIEPSTPQEASLSLVYGRWGDGYNVIGSLCENPPADGAVLLQGEDGHTVRGNLREYRSSPAQILSFISQGITLYPGDVVFCGRLSNVMSLPIGAYEAGYTLNASIEGLDSVITRLHKSIKG